MSNVLAIRQSLETRLMLLAPDFATQFENKTFKPTGNVPYQAVYMLLANPQNFEMGGSVQDTGYLQIDLRYPLGNGTGDVSAKAQSVRDWFPKGLTLTKDNTKVVIYQTPAILPGKIDGDRFTITLKAQFFCNASS